jgi:hypothetical protein
VPLQWRSDFANALASRWTGQLLSAIAASRSSGVGFRFLSGTTLDSGGLIYSGGTLSVQTSGLTSVRFGAGCALFCVGFGSDSVDVGPFSGPPFWETDSLAKPSCGLRSPPRVVISGGGDGALQDYLRAVTGFHTPRDLYSIVEQYLPVHALLTPLMSAEDVAHRKRFWSGSDSDRCAALRELHQVHISCVRTLRHLAGWRALVSHLLALIMSRGLISVHLVHRCDHFGACYPINRFLTLLVAACLQEGGMPSIMQSLAVHQVSGDRHACAGHWPACFGHSHTIGFRHEFCVSASPALGGMIADIVIVRHGVQAGRPIKFLAEDRAREHPVPYQA